MCIVTGLCEDCIKFWSQCKQESTEMWPRIRLQKQEKSATRASRAASYCILKRNLTSVSTDRVQRCTSRLYFPDVVLKKSIFIYFNKCALSCCCFIFCAIKWTNKAFSCYDNKSLHSYLFSVRLVINHSPDSSVAAIGQIAFLVLSLKWISFVTAWKRSEAICEGITKGSVLHSARSEWSEIHPHPDSATWRQRWLFKSTK